MVNVKDVTGWTLLIFCRAIIKCHSWKAGPSFVYIQLGEFALSWEFKLILFIFRFMMAPPLNIKPVNTNKQQFYLKQKEESLTKSENGPLNKSYSRDLSVTGRPRSLPAPKSSSLLNVSKIKSNHPSYKNNRSESEMGEDTCKLRYQGRQRWRDQNMKYIIDKKTNVSRSSGFWNYNIQKRIFH